MVIVIGAGRGIGKLSAFRVANKDTHIVCANLSQEIAEYTANELIEKYGVWIGIAGTGVSGCGPASGVGVDITSRESIRSMLEQVILAYGGVGNIIITPGWIVGIRDTAVS